MRVEKIGNATLYLGDCMEALGAMKENQFDLAIVDPPYGIGESSNDNKSRSKLGASKDYGKKNWDDNAPDKEYFTELKRASNNVIIWGANHFIESIPAANSSCWVVWDKQNGKNDFADCELAYCSFDTAVRKIELRWHGMLQHNMKNKEIRIHPTQKPVALYSWLLKNYAKEGDSLVDTHMGSGSSVIAALDAGHPITAYELDEEYFDAACHRIEQAQRQQKLF